MSFKEESQYLREYLWKYRGLVSLGVISLTLVDVLEIVPPLLLKETIDSLGEPSAKENLLKIVGVYLLVSALQALGRYGWRFFLIRTSMNAGRDLRSRYAEHLFGLGPSFFDRKKIGDLMSLATSDIEAIRMAMGGGMIIFLDALVYLLTVPIAMFYLSPRLTLLSFIPLLIVPFVVIKNERLIHDRFLKVQECFSRLSALAQENLMGIRVIKGFAREDAQFKRFKEVGQEYVKLNLSLAKIQSAFGPTLDFFMSLGLVVMLYLGGEYVVEGTLTIGTYIAFQRYIQKMIWPMTAVGLSITFYQRAVVGSQRLKEILDTKSDIPESDKTELPLERTKNARGKWQSNGQLEIKNLTFTYPGYNSPVLKNINLTARPGERIAVVGPIGSGKSTLLHLIPRLYPTPPNTIYLDGICVTKWPVKDLRDQIGFVSQDTFLFSETIFENVSFGLFEWSAQQDRRQIVTSSAEQASIHPDILRMEKSYDTKLSERAVNVSGGQKQRLTIARALACEPPVLILDDALSAVDMETENKILRGLASRPKRNTEIIAAHRISTVKEADCIYVFDKGEIKQQGRHIDLVKQKGSLYWKFYEQQRLQQEMDSLTKENPL